MKTLRAIENKVHIKVDSDHVQNENESFKFIMLEKMIEANYSGTKIKSNVNEYGQLTDVWIEFKNISDAMHFKLSWQSK